MLQAEGLSHREALRSLGGMCGAQPVGTSVCERFSL